MSSRRLDEDGLGAFIDEHYRGRGDVLFRMERLPLYAVEQQAAELQAWRTGGEPDMAAKQRWLDVLAAEVERGMLTQRVRILSAELSEDEARACHWGYPHVGRYEDVRVLRRGEHPVPDVLDHDYWVIRPAGRAVQVVRMDYSQAGAFLGAVVLPPAAHAAYLREQRQAWDTAEPFPDWWGRHGELHRRRSAA